MFYRTLFKADKGKAAFSIMKQQREETRLNVRSIAKIRVKYFYKLETS